MKSEAAAKATAAQSTPSRLPSIANCLTGAPLRMELRLLEFQNRRGELRVFVLFLLTCRLLRRASPHEGYPAPQGATSLGDPPTRRVRDAVGPSPAAARVERCVYITNPLMVRPNGSPATATARQRGFQLPLLVKMFCNQSCGNKHMDMLNLLLG